MQIRNFKNGEKREGKKRERNSGAERGRGGGGKGKRRKDKKNSANKARRTKERKFETRVIARSFYICLRLIVYITQQAMTNLFK